MNYKTINTTLALVISCALTAIAQLSQFNVVKPSKTGVPGEEVRVMKLDLDNRVEIVPKKSVEPRHRPMPITDGANR